MPSKSQSQHNFFAAIVNSPKFAKAAKVSSMVGKEFIKADKGGKFDRSKVASTRYGKK